MVCPNRPTRSRRVALSLSLSTTITKNRAAPSCSPHFELSRGVLRFRVGFVFRAEGRVERRDAMIGGDRGTTRASPLFAPCAKRFFTLFVLAAHEKTPPRATQLASAHRRVVGRAAGVRLPSLRALFRVVCAFRPSWSVQSWSVQTDQLGSWGYVGGIKPS